MREECAFRMSLSSLTLEQLLHIVDDKRIKPTVPIRRFRAM
jgi:hypothetical protein